VTPELTPKTEEDARFTKNGKGESKAKGIAGSKILQ
jgi:hypothetical protein